MPRMVDIEVCMKKKNEADFFGWKRLYIKKRENKYAKSAKCFSILHPGIPGYAILLILCSVGVFLLDFFIMTEADTAEALASLQLLMSEFFAPGTSNLRKREIESMLETFSNRRDAWNHCLLFLQKSENEYVLMFTLTTLENIINRQWMGITDAEKTEIRLTLWGHLTEKHTTMVYFIRNKLAALIVAIARYDWPHLYPDFFNNILELMSRGGRYTLLGLTLAHTASEELGTCRESCGAVPSARRLELQRLMLRGMPQLLHTLSEILEQNAQKECGGNPPPSPTNGAPPSAALPDLLATTPHNRELTMEIVIKCLNTLQHLFSWLPLSSHVPPALVTTVFYWGSAATQTQCSSAALAALGGVCELLYRRYAPVSSATTALRLHHCSLRLLRHLTHQPANIARAPHQYLNKLAEFLRLFVSLHFKRLEAEPEFDAIEFLTYLFQYTFQVPTSDIFVNCLDIWLQFIDVMKPEDTTKYIEALIALANGILNKIQFQHNKAQLQHLDNETVDDDGETEWQSYLKCCIECLARISELSPLSVFTLVLERWQGVAGVYARASARPPPAAPPHQDAERLLAALLDLATLTRALGRLAPSLLNNECEKRSTCVTACASLLERAAAILSGAVLTRPHHMQRADCHITGAMLQVHAEMFACMGSCACYAATCGVSTNIMEGLFSSAVPFLMPHEVTEPAILSHSAAHLILSLSKNIKFTTDPLTLVGDLLTQAHRSLNHLQPKTAAVVREALISLSLSRLSAAPGVALPRGEGVGAREEAAARTLLAAWSAPLLESPNEASAKHVLPILSQLLLAFTDAPTNAKKVLASGVQREASIALQLLCASHTTVAAELSEFFLALFTCLLQQLGDFADTAIDVFLDVARRGHGGEGVEHLLTCVRLGVERGSGGARLAGVLRLLTRHVLPLAAENAPRDLYRLLASILIHRWRYFFPSGRDVSEEQERMDELRAILTAIGQSLLQPDIEMYRLNLETLEQLNTKWKLYNRAIFRAEFLSSFLSVLLLTLVERRQALLRDETLSALHAMATVDLAAFQRAFLPAFLQDLPGLAPHQATSLMENATVDADLPTFTQNIQSLANDIYYYRMCNSFLAPNSTMAV